MIRVIRLHDDLVDLDRASEGWDLLFQYHGRPSGIYAADEYLAGLEAVRGWVHNRSGLECPGLTLLAYVERSCAWLW